MVIFRFRMANPNTIPLIKSFIGAMDLKLGVSIISLFALLNKVAGAYGILAILTGAPSTTAQLTLYLYSIATIVIFLWGLKKIGEEDGASTLIYAHLFALDHLVTTAYTTLFAVVWYVYVPHDGRRVANSIAQKEMMGEMGRSTIDDVSRKLAAELIWKEEKGVAAAVLLGGWLIKVYFILCLYSFALHLRRGSYHSLPLSQPMNSVVRTNSISFTNSPLSSNTLNLNSLPQYSIRNGYANSNTTKYIPLGKEEEDESSESNSSSIQLEELGTTSGKGTGMLTPNNDGRALCRSDSSQGQNPLLSLINGNGYSTYANSNGNGNPFTKSLNKLTNEDDDSSSSGSGVSGGNYR